MTPGDPEALRVAFRVLKTPDGLGVAYHLGGRCCASGFGSGSVARYPIASGRMSAGSWACVRGDLDVAYLAPWADRFGIRDVLDRLMSEV